MVSKMSDTLVNMFHGRIKYPWQEKGGQEKKKSEKDITQKMEPPKKVETTPVAETKKAETVEEASDKPPRTPQSKPN